MPLAMENNPELRAALSLSLENEKLENDSRRLANEIIGLGKKLGEVESLCSEVIATLNLEGNQHFFSDMPEMWHDLVRLWTSRWEAVNETGQNKTRD